MDPLFATLAEHPLRIAPYTSIRFSRRDGNGVPIYKVGTREVGGAERAMREAHARFGGACFYCGKLLPIDAAQDAFTLDHLQPTVAGGAGDLHNLVFCCKPCNAAKAATTLATFSSTRVAEYAAALERHLSRCLKSVANSGDAAVVTKTAPPALAVVGAAAG